MASWHILRPSIIKGDWRGVNIDDKYPEDVRKVQILLQIGVPGLISAVGEQEFFATKEPSAASGFAYRPQPKMKGRLLRIRRIVFRLRLSFHRLILLRRRRKADYGEKQKAKVLFEENSRNILRINSLQMTVPKNTHKKQCFAGLYYE
jgi:hypothetical protein